MEHRFCKRRDVAIPSSIYVQDELCGEGKITNISFDGAYLQFHGSDRLAVDSVIRIEFTLPVEGKAEGILTRMPAFIVHCGRKGVGVMFLHDDIDFARQLKKAVKCEAIQPVGVAIRVPVPAAQDKELPVRKVG